MRYEEFDDYEYSRDATRRGGGSRDYDRDYDRRDYTDYDRYSSRSDSYSRDYDGGYSSRSSYGSRNSYDRYAGVSRGSQFSEFDPYSWERTAPNWDRERERRAAASTKRRRAAEQSARSRQSGDRERREYRDSRASRDRRDSRAYSGGERRRRSEDPRRGERRNHRTEERGGIPKLVPIAIGIIFVIIIALIVKNLVSGSANSEYQVTFGSDTIIVGETTEATISGLADGSEPEVNWISGDTSVVTITESEGIHCTLTAKDEGTATIAATILPEDGGDEISISGTIEVVKTAPGVLGITMANETATVYSGEDYTISATVEMEDGYSPAKISWSSNDASVARVDENGVVSARDVGTAIITATAGEKTAEIAITVVENPNGTPPADSQIEGQVSDESITGTSTGSGDSGSADSGTTGSSTGSSNTGSSSTGSNSTGSSSSNTGSSTDSTGNTGSSTDSSTTGSSSTDTTATEGSSELNGSITGASPAE